MSDSEIKRISDFFYAISLEEDDHLRSGDDSEGLYQSVYEQLEKAGQLSGAGFPKAPIPKFGLSDRQMQKRGETLAIVSAAAKEAIARNDLSFVIDEVAGLLEDFRIDLDTGCLAYRRLATAVLRQYVAALKVKTDRHRGEVFETPVVQRPSPQSSLSGTLTTALQGWKKFADRPEGTVREFEHGINRFIELHGDLSITSITRRHVREFREALQAIPIRRSGALRSAGLPQLVEWASKHTEVQCISEGTVNKLLGAVQAVTVWGRGNGLVPDDVPWSDPFSGMRLEESEADREPWAIDELKRLFVSQIYTDKHRPGGGRGEAAHWLPLLGLYTGARLSEVALLVASDIITDGATHLTSIELSEDADRGRCLKTLSSRRIIPVHPVLAQLGFLTYVDERRKAGGDRSRLFPLIGSKSDVALWSKWFGRFIRDQGIEEAVFHSFRHGFKDCLRMAGESEDINDALTGQSGGGVGRRYGTKDMVRRFGLPRLAEAVAKVDYPGLDLAHCRWSGPATEPLIYKKKYLDRRTAQVSKSPRGTSGAIRSR